MQQPQEYNLVLKRLHRCERRARWYWAERVLTLGLVARLLLIGPAGTSLRDKARLQAQKAAENARLALAKSTNAARRVLLVRPALDPQVVMEDQREASIDAMPASADGMPPLRAARAVRGAVTRRPLNRQPALLAERSSASVTQASTTAAAPAAPAGTESVAAWSSSVSEAERQMARVAESNAEPVASLMDSPLASGAASFVGAGSAFPLPHELTAPQTVWKAVRAKGLDQTIAAGRDPFAFVGSPVAKLGAPAQAQSAQAVRSSPSEPLAAASAPALSSSVGQAPASVAPATAQAATTSTPPSVSLKALGYAISDDGNAQAVLTDGNTLYVVNEGEEFADRFRVIAIRPEALEVEAELTNQVIRLLLGD